MFNIQDQESDYFCIKKQTRELQLQRRRYLNIDIKKTASYILKYCRENAYLVF